MAKYKNIVGSGFPDYVSEQLQTRQNLVGQTNRTNTALQFLTNRNSFVRLSSGVLTKDNQNNFTSNLAKDNILQGGLVTVQDPNTATFKKRYTIGESDNLGYKPTPGITGLSIGTGGRWQTLLQADIEFICYDLDQLDVMSKLYMSLGCHVFLEWGHSPYVDNNGSLQNNINTLDFFSSRFGKQIDIIRKITELRKTSKGNYDALLGRVYNFDFNANSDGTYNCKIQVMGSGQMAESLKINAFSNIDYDKNDTKESIKYSSSLSNALISIKKLLESNGSNLLRKETQSLSGDFVPNNPEKLINELRVVDTNNPLYIELLNTIYSNCSYKGPQFNPPTPTFTSRVTYKDNVSQYGNAHQVLSNVAGGNDNLPIIPPSFYNGYVTLQPSQIESEESVASLSTYITLGHLMTLIQHVGIFVESPTDTLDNNEYNPVLRIDYHPENTIINRGPLEASIDPNICYIPLSIADREIQGKSYSNAQSYQRYLKPLNTLKNDLKTWSGITYQINNRTKNLFLNPSNNKINNGLKKYVGDSFEGKLFNVLINLDFAISTLKNLSSGEDTTNVSLQSYLKSILDGINISLGQVNNFRVFFDDNSQCIRIVDETVVEPIDRNKLLTIPNYGTNSTTYDYEFQSKIGPNLASQLVIATQSETSGGIQEFSEDVLTYKKLNDDVQDRFVKKITKGNKNSTDIDNENGSTEKSLQAFFDHVYLCYSNDTTAKINPTTISSLKNTYKELQNTQKKFLKQPYGNVLIPLEYSITIDGISGILPYNAFVVPDNRLPKRYRDKSGRTKVAFAVFSINHNFSNNQWTTTLRGQTLLIDKASLTDNTNPPSTT